MGEIRVGVYCAADDANAAFAAGILSDEIERRCQVIVNREPNCAENFVEVSISVKTDNTVESEGFILTVSDGNICICASTRLGLVYGAGRFIALCSWEKGVLHCDDTEIHDRPEKKLRGMQLSYNSSTNAYYIWSKETYAQYICELIMYGGANAIELLAPSVKDEKDDAALRKCGIFEMTVFLSEYIHSFGAKVWLFYPNLINQFIDRANTDIDPMQSRRVAIKKALKERDKMLCAIPFVDSILMPSGDPGDLTIDELFGFAGEMAEILTKYHRDAKIWLSCQNMNSPGVFKERFYEEVNKKPDWLGGVVYGPWTDHLLSLCRENTPPDLPVRGYPDICHSLCCQYPVHGWDTVWALTAGRECYNPRPHAHKLIHEKTKDYLVGNIPYTEGIADDVSKYIWLSLDWNSEYDTTEILEKYARIFICSEYTKEIASAIALIEEVPAGSSMDVSFARSAYLNFKKLNEKLCRSNNSYGSNCFRFKMPYLMSAFYAYESECAVKELNGEARAWENCEDESLNADEMLDGILDALAESAKSPNPALRKIINELADELYNDIGWRLSVPMYNAKDYSRGAFLDCLDIPLNNRIWIEANLNKLRDADAKELTDDEIITEIKRLRDRNYAGVGGKYISFGDADSLKYVELDKSWEDEPCALTIPRIEHYVDIISPQSSSYDLSKCARERVSSILGYYNCSVKLKIGGLIPHSEYELRIVFPLRFKWFGQKEIPTAVKSGEAVLEAMGTVDGDEWVYRFAVPRECVSKSGELTLEIIPLEGTRGSGVSELWLIKKD